MNSTPYLSWNTVKNDVSARLQDNSLIHTFSSKVKISASTKLVNNHFKKFRIRNYRHFVYTKKDILENLCDNESVTEVSDFSDDDYQKFHKGIENIDSEESSNDSDDDRFKWIIVTKNNLNKSKDRSVTKLRKPRSRQTNLNSWIKKESNKTIDNNVSEDNESKEEDITSKQKENVVEENTTKQVKKAKTKSNSKEVHSKKKPENIKRNLTLAINDVISNTLTEDESNDEFASTEFQAQSTQIFCDTFSETKRNTNSNCRKQLHLKNENYPRDSGIEEDSKDGNGKCEDFVSYKKTNKQKIDTSDEENFNHKHNKKHESEDEFVCSTQINTSNKKKKKFDNSLNRQKDKVEHKLPIKIIGEEKIEKKLKIIRKNTVLKPIEEEQTPETKSDNKNINDSETEKSNEISDISDSEFKDSLNIEIAKPVSQQKEVSSDEYYDVPDNNYDSESQDVNEEPHQEKSSTNRTDDFNKNSNSEKEFEDKDHITLKDKLKRCKSPYMIQKYKELKQLKLIAESDFPSSEDWNYNKNLEEKEKNDNDINNCSDESLSNSIISEDKNLTNFNKKNHNNEEVTASKQETDHQNNKKTCFSNVNEDESILSDSISSQMSQKNDEFLKNEENEKDNELSSQGESFEIKIQPDVHSFNNYSKKVSPSKQTSLSNSEDERRESDNETEIDADIKKKFQQLKKINLLASSESENDVSQFSNTDNNPMKKIKTKQCKKKNQILKKIYDDSSSDEETNSEKKNNKQYNIDNCLKEIKENNDYFQKNYNSDVDIKEHKILLPNDAKKLDLTKNIDLSTSHSKETEEEKLNTFETTKQMHSPYSILEQSNSDVIVKNHEVLIKSPKKSDEENVNNNSTLQNKLNELQNSKNDSDDESDRSLSPSTIKRLMQCKKMNLQAESSTSSESENDVNDKVDKSDKNKILHKQTVLGGLNEPEKINTSKFFKKSVSHSSLLSDSNISLKSNSFKLVVSENSNHSKECVADVHETNKNEEDSNKNNNNDKKHTIISETQDIANEIQQNLASQDIFSSFENLTEGINSNHLIEQIDQDNKNNNFENVSQIPSNIPLIEDENKKVQSISDLIDKENLLEDCYETTITLNSIHDNEELFIINVPKSVFETNLIGKKFSFSKTTLKLGNDKYEAFQKRVLPTLSCVFKSKKNTKNSFKTLNIRPVTSIFVRRKKYVDSQSDSDTDEQKKIFRPSSKSPKFKNISKINNRSSSAIKQSHEKTSTKKKLKQLEKRKVKDTALEKKVKNQVNDKKQVKKNIFLNDKSITEKNKIVITKKRKLSIVSNDDVESEKQDFKLLDGTMENSASQIKAKKYAKVTDRSSDVDGDEVLKSENKSNLKMIKSETKKIELTSLIKDGDKQKEEVDYKPKNILKSKQKKLNMTKIKSETQLENKSKKSETSHVEHEKVETKEVSENIEIKPDTSEKDIIENPFNKEIRVKKKKQNIRDNSAGDSKRRITSQRKRTSSEETEPTTVDNMMKLEPKLKKLETSHVEHEKVEADKVSENIEIEFSKKDVIENPFNEEIRKKKKKKKVKDDNAEDSTVIIKPQRKSNSSDKKEESVANEITKLKHKSKKLETLYNEYNKVETDEISENIEIEFSKKDIIENPFNEKIHKNKKKKVKDDDAEDLYKSQRKSNSSEKKDESVVNKSKHKSKKLKPLQIEHEKANTGETSENIIKIKPKTSKKDTIENKLNEEIRVKKKKKKVKDDSSEDPKLIIKPSQRKRKSSEKKKESAADEIMNFIKKNIDMDTENHDFSITKDKSLNYKPLDIRRTSAKKRFLSSSSSDEDDEKFVKRSFHIRDRSEEEKDNDTTKPSMSFLSAITRDSDSSEADIKKEDKKKKKKTKSVYFDE